LSLIGELEEQIEDEDTQRRLELARNYIASASNNIGGASFNRQFAKAMGIIASVAVARGHDELAGQAIELGGEVHG
jgi:hypothetical protein